MISVVVPIYNVSSFLCRCLDSIYKYNTDIEIEVLLVNDGSTDDSLLVCKRYKEKFPIITRIIDKENGGLSDARNAGTALARGEWVYYLDGDDRLATGALRKLSDYALNNGCQMVAGGFYYDYGDYLLYDDRWLKDPKPFVLSRESAMEALIKQQYMKNFAWGKLYKADIAKRHPFRKGVYYEDSYWQHLIIDDCNRIGVLPEPLYYYLQRDGSISGTLSEKNLDLLKGNEERLHFIEKKYPMLLSEAVVCFWKQCRGFYLYAGYTNSNGLKDLFSSYLSEVETKYKVLLEASLSKNLEYRHRNNSIVSQVNYLSQRIWDYFFGKKLKRTEINAEYN